MSRFVLDASAIVTIYENRAGAEKLAALLQQASEGKAKLAMSVVNWGEVYYSIWRTGGPGVAKHVIGNALQFGAARGIEAASKSGAIAGLLQCRGRKRLSLRAKKRRRRG